MSDYISRHAAIDALAEQIALCDKALKSFGISMKDEYAVKVERTSLIAYKEQLEAIPAADVVPVVHGKWIRSGAEGHIICNKCGYEAKYTIVERQDATGKWTSRFAQDIKTNFCPNCGAKMDGERKE